MKIPLGNSINFILFYSILFYSQSNALIKRSSSVSDHISRLTLVLYSELNYLHATSFAKLFISHFVNYLQKDELKWFTADLGRFEATVHW